MDIKELQQFLIKIELKDLEKERGYELQEVGELMINQGYILKTMADANNHKERISNFLNNNADFFIGDKEKERKTIKEV